MLLPAASAARRHETAPRPKQRKTTSPVSSATMLPVPGDNDASDFFNQVNADQPPAVRSALPGHLSPSPKGRPFMLPLPPLPARRALLGRQREHPPVDIKIYPSEESEGDKLITRAHVLGDFESAVSVCINSDRASPMLSSSRRPRRRRAARQGAKGLLEKRTAQLPYLRLFQSIVSDDLSDVVQKLTLANGKRFLLSSALSPSRTSSAIHRAARSASRIIPVHALPATRTPRRPRSTARTPYFATLAAGKLEKVAGMWIDEMKEEELALRSNSKGTDDSHQGTLYSARAEALQTFMEKITVFPSAVGYVDVDLQQPTQDSIVAETGARSYKLAPLYDRIHEYVELPGRPGSQPRCAQLPTRHPPTTARRTC